MSTTFRPQAIHQALLTGLHSTRFYFPGSQDHRFPPMGSGGALPTPSPASLGRDLQFPCLFLRPASGVNTQSGFAMTVCSHVA